VDLVWWRAASALFAASAALFRIQVAILSAANPTTPLPWIGRPANMPRGAKALGYLATVTGAIAVDFVIEALNWRHLYDVLWSLPFWAVVMVVITVSQAKHNRRIRRAAESR
jgi:hypothetical protein